MPTSRIDQLGHRADRLAASMADDDTPAPSRRDSHAEAVILALVVLSVAALAIVVVVAQVAIAFGATGVVVVAGSVAALILAANAAAVIGGRR
jgi:hypothetical protein